MSEFIRPAPDSQFRLKPCVCGSEYVVYQPSTEDPRPFYRVMCLSCGRQTPWHLSQHDAQCAWNEMVSFFDLMECV